ncbi:hypothetical protein [Kordia sp.]|uniref:hypothetical protein n=1 Tax=Kordia sp. TaxID=1965332 RepID=UPI003D2A357F
MSYIKSLKIATELLPDIELQNFTEKDLIRIEKLLKVEQKVNPDFKATTINVFLNSLKEHPEGVRFLFANPNLKHLLTRSFAKMQKNVTVQLEGFDAQEIVSFISKYLTEDFTDSINYYFNKEIYQPVTKMLLYKDVIPDEVINLIRRKTDGKIDFLTNKLDKIINDSPIYKDSFFALTEKLNDEGVNEKVKYFRSLSIKYSLNIATTRGPGIVVFFKILGNGLHWLSTKPKNIEEKIERKLALEDFRFISYFLIGFAVLIISAIIYNISSSAEKDRNKEQAKKVEFTKSMRGFLTEFDPAQARNIKYVDSLFESGDNPFPLEYIKGGENDSFLARKKQFINQTEYDIIVLSNDVFAKEIYDKTPYRFLVKSGDTIAKNCISLNHFYIGKKLALFNSNEQYIPKRYNAYDVAPRFLELYKDARHIISLQFESRGNIVFTQKDGKIYITSDKSLYVNGIPTKESKL